MSNAETAVPLRAPLHRATFTEAIGWSWKQCARFDGRAGHREYGRTFAFEARRLHDADRCGFLLFIHLASWPGAIAVLALTQLSANPLGRRFDAPPGAAPRFARIGSWPAAPGEPEVAYRVGCFDAARSASHRPLTGLDAAGRAPVRRASAR